MISDFPSPALFGGGCDSVDASRLASVAESAYCGVGLYMSTNPGAYASPSSPFGGPSGL